MGGAFFSGISQISASVVSIRDAIEEAFWSAVRATLVGSMTPGLHQVLVLAGLGVEAEVDVVVRRDLLDDDSALEAGVLGDLAQRLLAGAPARC